MKKIYLLIIIIFAAVYHSSASGRFNDSYPKDSTEEKSKKKRYGTDHMFNIDLGINNYHKDGEFPDEDNSSYSVKPWGSWYIALNSLHRSHIAGSIFLEWGGGVSWYNFKFQNENIQLVEGANGPEFIDYAAPDAEINPEKSKLTVSHVNLYMVPLIQFGKNKGIKGGNFWDGRDRYRDLGFRIGAGGYVGYRLGSHTKIKYEDESGDTEKAKDHDNFYLENLRYGVRLQLGYRGTDLFVNYDLNNLFSENRGPELSPVSFGFIF